MNVATLALLGLISTAEALRLSGTTWDQEPLTCAMNLERLQNGSTDYASVPGSGVLYQDK